MISKQQVIANTQQVFGNIGLLTLGVASPAISVSWTSGQPHKSTPASDKSYYLVSEFPWKSPAAGYLAQEVKGHPAVKKPPFVNEQGQGILKLFPQTILRLEKLFRTYSLEVSLLPTQFVYFTDEAVKPGKYLAGCPMTIFGTMAAYNQAGDPINLIDLASSFNQLLSKLPILNADLMKDLRDELNLC